MYITGTGLDASLNDYSTNIVYENVLTTTSNVLIEYTDNTSNVLYEYTSNISNILYEYIDATSNELIEYTSNTSNQLFQQITNLNVDSKDANTLETSKNYTDVEITNLNVDSKDANTLQTSKNYTDVQITNLNVDSKDANTLQSAKNYTDTSIDNHQSYFDINGGNPQLKNYITYTDIEDTYSPVILENKLTLNDNDLIYKAYQSYDFDTQLARYNTFKITSVDEFIKFETINNKLILIAQDATPLMWQENDIIYIKAIDNNEDNLRESVKILREVREELTSLQTASVISDIISGVLTVGSWVGGGLIDYFQTTGIVAIQAQLAGLAASIGGITAANQSSIGYDLLHDFVDDIENINPEELAQELIDRDFTEEDFKKVVLRYMSHMLRSHKYSAAHNVLPYPAGLDDYDNLSFRQAIGYGKPPRFDDDEQINTILYDKTGITDKLFVSEDIIYDCTFDGNDTLTAHKYFINGTSLKTKMTSLDTDISEINNKTTDDIPQGTNNKYSQWNDTGNNIYYNAGNVGIGTNDPSEILEVDGNIKCKGRIFQDYQQKLDYANVDDMWIKIGKYQNTANCEFTLRCKGGGIHDVVIIKVLHNHRNEGATITTSKSYNSPYGFFDKVVIDNFDSTTTYDERTIWVHYNTNGTNNPDFYSYLNIYETSDQLSALYDLTINQATQPNGREFDISDDKEIHHINYNHTFEDGNINVRNGDVNITGKYKIENSNLNLSDLEGTTDDVLEGTNKYYSDSLVESYLGSYNIFLDYLEHPDNAMTTYTEHGYTVLASSELGTAWKAYQAFDKISTGSVYNWISGNNTYYDQGDGNYKGNKFIIDTDSIQHDGEWVKIRLPNAKIIKYCDVYPRSFDTAPKSGVILASNDDTNWVHLSSFTDKTYLPNQATRIDINSSRVYEYYMILIKTTDGGRAFTAIGEIKFFEPNLFNNGSINTSGNVGIGTTDPASKLDVVGDVNITGKYKINGNDLQYSDLSNLPTDFDTNLSNVVDGTTITYTGGTLTAVGGGGGGSSQWTTAGSDIYYTTGNVGIGIATPDAKLDVVGDIKLTGSIYNEYQTGVIPSGTKWIKVAKYYYRCNCKFIIHYNGSGQHDLLEIEVKYKIRGGSSGQCLIFKSCTAHNTQSFFSDIYIENYTAGYGIARNIWVKHESERAGNPTFYTYLERYNQLNPGESSLYDLTTYQTDSPTGGRNFKIQDAVIQTVNYNHEITDGNLSIGNIVDKGYYDLAVRNTICIGQLAENGQNNADTNIGLRISGVSEGTGAQIQLSYLDDNDFANIAVNTTIGQISFGINEAFNDATDEVGRPWSLIKNFGSIKMLTGDRGYLSTLGGRIEGDLTFSTSYADSPEAQYDPNAANIDVERMRIKYNGNVGIGTTNPTEKLHLNGFLKCDSGDHEFLFGTPGGQTGLIFNGSNTGNRSRFNMSNHAYTTVSNRYFRLGYGNDICIRQNGNVGIGKTNPDSKLDVNGSIRGGFDGNTTSYFGRSAVGYCGHNDHASFCHINRNNTTDYGLLCNPNGLTYLNCATNQSIQFRVANSTKMIMTSSGYFGLGTNTPFSKLHVNGDIRSDGIITIGSGIYKYLKVGYWHIYQATSDYNNYGDLDQNDLVFSYQPNGYLQDPGLGWIQHNDIYIDIIDNTFQHRSVSKNKNLYDKKYVGYIVSAISEYKDLNSKYKNRNRNIKINQALPYIDLSDKQEDKAVFGVISDSEEDNKRTYHAAGVFKSSYKQHKGDKRIIINSGGEGAIWISNYNGNIENGDYITTSPISGIGMRQNSDSLKNYTVAKATCSVDFNNLQSYSLEKVKQEYIYTSNVEISTSNIQTSNLIYTSNYNESNVLYITSNIEISNQEINVSNIIVKSNLENVLDSNGDLIYEIQYDENSNIIYESEYDIKYVKLDGTIIDYNEYNSNVDYIMAFVGCTYHCG